MAQIAKVVLNNGQNSVDFDPLRCNGSGQASFRDNSKSQDNLKDLVHVTTGTNSNGTRKSSLDVIHRSVITNSLTGTQDVAGTANIAISCSFPASMPAVERGAAYELAKSAMTQLQGVLRDGEVLF